MKRPASSSSAANAGPATVATIMEPPEACGSDARATASAIAEGGVRRRRGSSGGQDASSPPTRRRNQRSTRTLFSIRHVV
eukprot:11853615-Alexandrium_andersonii.AAC.1